MTVKISNVGGSWHVSCTVCSDELFGFAFRPWLRAEVGAWKEALWWANWHAAEHERLRCVPCGRTHKIPAVKILDRDAVKVGERLFTRSASGPWVETPAPKAAV